MMKFQKVILLGSLVFLASNVSAGDAPTLEALRFFFTPEQRNPLPLKSPPVVPLPAKPASPEITHLRAPSLRYVGEIRSSKKRRIFWKKGEERYLSSVP